MDKTSKTSDDKQNALPKSAIKIIRINLIIAAVLHLFVAASMGSPNRVGLQVFIQYIVSSWILRKFIVKREMNTKEISLYSWAVSFVILLVRIALGMLLFPSLYAR